MLTSTALLVVWVQVFFAGSALATQDWWLQGLPKCWQSCFNDTQDGCTSSKCICKTTGSTASYLPSAVSCAVSKCSADTWALDLVLGPLELYCVAIGSPIPGNVLGNAYTAASAGPSSATPVVSAKSVKSTSRTTKASEDVQDLTSTIKSTLTRTTTDSSGNTLLVAIPLIVGPSGLVTGAMATSTVTNHASSPNTDAALSNPSAALPSPTATQHEPSHSPSAAGNSGSGRVGSSNGSPFDNMQAEASRWVMSGAVTCMAALSVAIFVF